MEKEIQPPTMASSSSSSSLFPPRPVQSRARSSPSVSLHKLLTDQEMLEASHKPPPTRGRGRGGRGWGVGAAVAPLLYKWDEIPPWQQDNAYILSHYRPVSNSYMGCIQSLFYLHNESVNIHSHLLGCFLFLSIGISVYAFEEAGVVSMISGADVLVFACFFFGAVFCLGMSATYHLISNHSAEVNRWGNQLDYVGIVALITGSFVPSVYYGFFCEPGLQRRYWGMIILLATACTTVTIRPKFRTPSWRPFRASMFVAMGLSAVFPVLHGLSKYGAVYMNEAIGLPWLVLQGGLYILGATVYAMRTPERLKPGTFDLFGSSHQIFHILILLAAMSHLLGLLTAFHTSKRPDRCHIK